MPLPAIIAAGLRFGGRAAAANVFEGGHLIGAASRAGGMAAKGAGEAIPKQTPSLLKQMAAQWLVFNARLQHGTSLLSAWTHAYVSHLMLVNTAIEGMAAPVKALVGLANPARARMFDLAMMDANAVVGRMLIPTMDAFTRTARKWGDTLAGFEPVLEPLNKATAHLADSIGTGLRDAAIQCAPQIAILTDAIVTMAEAAAWAARHMGTALKYHLGFQIGNYLAIMAGTGGRQFDASRTSMGAAAHEARFVGAKDIANEAIKNAMMLGAGVDRAKTTEGILEDILKLMQQFSEQWARAQPGGDGAPDPWDVVMDLMQGMYQRGMTGRIG